MNAPQSVKHQHTRSWWRDALLRLTGSGTLTRTRPSWIPIRKLSPRHRPKILQHLVRLEPQDRYLRFGYPATDEQIGRYVDGLNFVRDEIYGVFNRRLELVAMAHLAFSIDPQWATCAEFRSRARRRTNFKGATSEGL